MVTSVMVQFVEHEYRSNQAVSYFQYHILLEKPWHERHNLMNNYKTGNVSLDNEKLLILKVHEQEGIKVTKLS